MLGCRLSLCCSDIVDLCRGEDIAGGELGEVSQLAEDLAAVQSTGVFVEGGGSFFL